MYGRWMYIVTHTNTLIQTQTQTQTQTHTHTHTHTNIQYIYMSDMIQCNYYDYKFIYIVHCVDTVLYKPVFVLIGVQSTSFPS